MRNQIRSILWMFIVVAGLVMPIKVQAQEVEKFDFDLITEQREYQNPNYQYQYPLIIKGNDEGASYTTSLETDVDVHYAIEGEWQINAQAVEVQRTFTITGTSSTGCVIEKRYHVSGTYVTGFNIELVMDNEEKCESETVQGFEHEHYYEPAVVIKATKWSDGVEAKACTQCGDVTESIGVSGAHVFLQETYQMIAAAKAGQTIQLEFGTYNSLPQELIQRIADRNDVNFQIHFLYENENYDFTIERGANLDTSQAWYGPEMLIQTFQIYRCR